jgi:uncharacterized cupredoxin-like copper-binding protein
VVRDPGHTGLTTAGRFSPSIVPLAIAALVASCGGAGVTTGPSGTPAGSPGTPVAITLREFAVDANPGSVTAGPVTFQIANSGAIEHSFVIVGPTGLGADGLPSDDGGQTVDVEEVGEKGELDAIAAGSSVTLNATLPAGNYVLICNIASHYSSGMRVAFSVH